MADEVKTYRYEVTYIGCDGQEKTRAVIARHEFEATQLADAVNKVVISIINLDL